MDFCHQRERKEKDTQAKSDQEKEKSDVGGWDSRNVNSGEEKDQSGDRLQLKGKGCFVIADNNPEDNG